MRILLDTHALLWAVESPDRLGPLARELLEDPTHQLLVSTASVWEITIKVGLGKLRLSMPLKTWVLQSLQALDAAFLDLSLDAMERLLDLPFIIEIRSTECSLRRCSTRVARL